MFDFKPFSRKQLDVICNADAFINILEGSVRSGKTIASIVAWITFVIESPHRIFLMTGGTSDTLYRNVIEDIERIVGPRRARYVKSAKGGGALRLTLRNPDYPHKSKRRNITKICYCVGAADHRSEGRIRGMTVGGWYADEVTLHPEAVIKQATNRMSLDGARAIWTTNPDSPFHFIKTEFIDKALEKGYKHWHFQMEDNLALGARYISNIKSSYTGLWYKRMVEGLWVQAEGSVYDMFDQELNTFSDEISDSFKHKAQRYISVDVGTQNATVFLDCWDDGDTVWITNEYYYSGRDRGVQRTNAQYVEDMRKFVGDTDNHINAPRFIIVDPAAADFKLSLRHARFRVKDADHEVLPGISMTATMIAHRKIKIHRVKCPNLLKEITSYVWDPRAAQRGVEQPLKVNDHACDALRYYIYTMVNKRRVHAA